MYGIILKLPSYFFFYCRNITKNHFTFSRFGKLFQRLTELHFVPQFDANRIAKGSSLVRKPWEGRGLLLYFKTIVPAFFVFFLPFYDFSN